MVEGSKSESQVQEKLQRLLEQRIIREAGKIKKSSELSLLTALLSQLQEKIIPIFEDVHGPGYWAMFMINNS